MDTTRAFFMAKNAVQSFSSNRAWAPAQPSRPAPASFQNFVNTRAIYTPPPRPSVAQSFNNFVGKYNAPISQAPYAKYVPPTPSYYVPPASRPQVQGANTYRAPTPSSGGGGGGGGGGSLPPSFSGDGGGGGAPPMIGYPSQPSFDFDALIAPALAALDQAVTPANAAYESDVADIGAQQTKATGTAKANTKEQQDILSGRRTTEQTTSENAINEARRGYSEISQGIQARYGGTTGTGAFATEIAGAGTQRSIGQHRQQLSDAIGRIDDTSLRVKQLGDSALADIDASANAMKAKAKANLEDRLNQIRMAKAELQGRKAEMAFQAMQMYQNTVNQITVLNGQFKQQLFAEQQRIDAVLGSARQTGATRLASLQGGSYGGNPNYSGFIQGQEQGSPQSLGTQYYGQTKKNPWE